MPGFKIESATLDLVYGKIAAVAGKTPMIPRVSSVSFQESESSRTSSGSPGYIKTKPLKVASRHRNAAGDDWMLELKEGMYLRGADNTGKCIQLDRSQVGSPESLTPEAALAKHAHTYSEDPQLTFEDSFMYGCHLDLDYEELRKFCAERQFEELVLFQYLNKALSHFGRFGNSDPRFVRDWVEIKKAERGKASPFDDN